MQRSKRMKCAEKLADIANDLTFLKEGWFLSREVEEHAGTFIGETCDLIYGVEGTFEFPPWKPTDHERRTYAGIIAAAIEAGDLP